MLGWRWKPRAPKLLPVPEMVDPYDPGHALLDFSGQDPWTIGHSFEGTQIFGATGAGKTSGSGQAIAKAMLRFGYGGLVLTAKPDEYKLWEKYCTATRRSQSLMRFSADGPYRFNFLDYARATAGGDGLTENIVTLFSTVLESVERSSGGGGQDPFWQRALRQLLRNAIDLLVIAEHDLTLANIAKIITSAPQNPESVKDPHWQSGSECFRALGDADARARAGALSPIEANDLEQTVGYWLGEFPRMAERTRSNIVATFTTMADGFLRGQLRELFGTTTNIAPELTHRGVIIVVDLPVKSYHELGRFAQLIWKYLWQRATEGPARAGTGPPVFLWADEAQNFITPHDRDFQATARSSRAATVYLTQNIGGYYAAMGGSGGEGRAAADSFLGNLNTKIFHCNGDHDTNRWAEEHFAQVWIERTNLSTTQNPAENGTSRTSVTGANQRSLEAQVLAHDFSMLKTGGPDCDFTVEAYISQTGRRWAASQSNALKTMFGQKGK